MTRLAKIGILLALTAGTTAAGAQVRFNSGDVELSEILATLGRISELYQSQALSFTCVERISVLRYLSQDRIGSRKGYRFDYYYGYDAGEDGRAAGAAGLRDYRMDIDSRGDPNARPVDLLQIGIPAAITRAYSWIFMFQPGLQQQFVFIQEADGRALGRDAWVIGFEPRAPYYIDFNDWFGRVWIDKESFQLLRAEAVQSPDYVYRQDPRYADLPATAGDTVEGGSNPLDPSAGEGTPVTDTRYLFAHVKVEFDEVKNGLRFPTKIELVGKLQQLDDDSLAGYRQQVSTYLEKGIQRDRFYRIDQSYRDYRFFGVQTQTEVDATVRGVRQNP